MFRGQVSTALWPSNPLNFTKLSSVMRDLDDKSFTIKTLRSMIESQARWTEDDLKRLNLVDEKWWHLFWPTSVERASSLL